MPMTMVTMMPRGLGPGVMKRASRPTTRPMSRTPMIVVMFVSPSDLECRHDRHVVGCRLPIAQVDVDTVTRDGARQRRRGQDVIEPPSAIGQAPVVVAVTPPRIELLVR